jgi:hypothetical protein
MRKPISERKLLALIQQFAAVDAVGTSAVRGQPAGTKAAIQQYLAKIRLSGIPNGTCSAFKAWLDHHTKCIQRKLPNPSAPWGIARKTLNLFMRACYYNHYLRSRYGLGKIGRWLEVPLDGVVARGLKKDAGRGVLPRWAGLERLEQQDSDEFQKHAREYASACKLPVTIFLDNYLWLHGRFK